MAASLADKLRIKEGYILRTINVPAGFREDLGPLPNGVKISATSKNPNQVHWFVKERKQMESEINLILPLMNQDRICWIYFPKGSSRIQTDLSRDKGCEELMKHDFQWISLISFNNTWSAFGLRSKTPGAGKKEASGTKQGKF